MDLARVLICDTDRAHTALLTAELSRRRHEVEVTRSYAEAFATACARDFDVLLAAPFLGDGSALVLPVALGVRRPKLVLLMSRLGERIRPAVARCVGFDGQLTKVVRPVDLDRVMRVPVQRSSAEGPSLPSPAPHH